MGYINTLPPKAPVLTADNIQDPERLPFYNLKEMVANRAAALMWGRGIKISVRENAECSEEAKERLKEIIRKNNFQGLFYELEKRLSTKGCEYVSLEMLNKVPYFHLASEQYPQGIARVGVWPTHAVLWKLYIFDMAEIPTLEIWTTKKVKRMFFRDMKRTIMPLILTTDEKIPNDLVPKEEFVHNMGFLPVWQIKNKPNWGNFADPDATAIEFVQIMVNKLTESLYKELEKNQTRVLTTMNDGEINKLGKDGSGIKKIINDYIFHMGNRSDVIKSPINVLMGDPKIANYILGIEKNINHYFALCGYNSPLGDTTDIEQSATQSMNNNRLDIETTKSKTRQRIIVIKDMIEKAILLDKKFGVGDIGFPDIEDIEISIPGNIAVSPDDTLRQIQTAIPLGIMSKVRAISMIKDISEDEAKKELETIRQEQEKDMEMENKYMNEEFPENEGWKNNNPMDKPQVGK